ncbi:hypothetical protein [Aliikangiella sp. IMCC44359]|uniref:hypothetical protein n=1 Tax=Aliikangiella sp. IMCC44359 TaxID=3459125 RepID=UPI00403AF366
MSTLALNVNLSRGWLRSAKFDGLFLYGIAALALGTGAIVSWQPQLFFPILFLDLWLLGYHHVIATFTRLLADKTTRQEFHFLIYYLPIIVVASVALLAFTTGEWVISTIYLHWQWFHYLRQSDGISKAYSRKSGKDQVANPKLNRVVFYLWPLMAFMTMSARDPATFLGSEVFTIVLPPLLLLALQLVTAILFVIYAFNHIKAFLAGVISIGYASYLLIHYTIFSFAYFIIKDISIGWLVINIWHNAQYIGFVWFYNTNRYQKKASGNNRFLSYISQPSRFPIYFISCFIITTIIYYSIDITLTHIAPSTSLLLFLIVYQAINFHHYIVDSLIWKLRKPKLQETLGLKANQ